MKLRNAKAEMPAGLGEALAERDAHVVRSWSEASRHYAFAESAGTCLFARYTTDRADEHTLSYERSIRERIGSEGVLRAPPVLAAGNDWLLERGIMKRPFGGVVDVDRALAAAAQLASLDLPEREHRRQPFASAQRRLRTLASPVPFADVRAARRIRNTVKLPLVTTHGDYHRNNLLVEADALWVIDWELSARGPAGSDLLHLWCSLDGEEDRDRLFRGAVELVGRSHEPALLALRYSSMVATIVALLASHHGFDRDRSRAEQLLARLPQLRTEARASF
jgi:hypothetical protein